MLRACHRILKPGGLIAFAVITLPDRLTGADLAEAIEAGPPHLDTGPGYPKLMRAAGFDEIETADVTDEYLETSRAWVREWDADAAHLISIVGSEEFAEMQANRRRAVDAISRGLLRRHLISGRRP